MTLAVGLPSPGTAMVRDLWSGHLVHTRMRLARESSWVGAVGADFGARGRGGGLRLRLRLRLREEGARLSISQFLSFEFRGRSFRVFFVQNFLEGHGGARGEIGFV